EGEPFSISVWIGEEETINAKILAYTDQKDMCILKLAYPIPLDTVRFADSAAQGEAVYAVGFPAAADYLSDTEAHTSAAATITDGIISAIREVTVSDHGTAIKMLQINAAINSGNSGGPLFNADGEVVGINTYGINESQGIFGAIGISELTAFMAENGINVKSGSAGLKSLMAIVVAAIAALICVGAIILVNRRKSKPKHPNGKVISLRAFMESKPQDLGGQELIYKIPPYNVKMHSSSAGTLEALRKTVEETEGEPRKKGLKTSQYAIIIAAIVAVIVIFAGTYMLGYSKADFYANAGEHKTAEKWLFASEITKIHDPQLVAYLDAHALLADCKYEEAKAAFAILGKYIDSAQMMCEVDYRHAAQCAEDNEFDVAIALFAALAEVEYKDSAEKVYETRYKQGAYILYELKDFKTAQEIFKALQSEGYENAAGMINEVDYLWAWSYFESGEYIEAYKKFRDIKDYLDSNKAMEDLTELIYSEGQELYRSGDYVQAAINFYCVEDYSKSKDYLVLIHIHKYGNTNADAKTLLDLFYLEDAADLLLKHHEIAEEILRGTWESRDGLYYFKMYTEEKIESISVMGEIFRFATSEICTSYNLPCYNGDHGYKISDNTYYLLDASNTYKPAFAFTMTAPDCMDVYCYKDGSTYTLYRN
ncbi:MAG: trypsin-like peptidase domain-containing protein, partial [Oscillospiraceae bacterium]|nr:trypsin-like peptidase domain-containing protein [Oscillospiraceae bacterium]